jgi:hypothetical protein
MAYGRSGHLAIHFQNSFGTSNTSSAHFIPLISETVQEKIGQLIEDNLYGRLAESPYHEGLHEVSGEIRTEAHPIYLGAFLKAALGGVTTTAQGSAFLHEFLPKAADWDEFAAVPPLTLEIHRDAGSAFLYYDVLASELSLEIAHGQLLSAGLAVVGGRFSRKASAVPSFHAGRPWTWDVVSASYDGGAIADLRQLTLRFNNQLAAFHTLGGGKAPRRVKRDGAQQVGVEGALLLQDQALFQRYLDQSERRLLLTFAGETIANSYAALLTLDVPRLRFGEFKPALSGPGQLEVAFAGNGVYDTSSGYALRVTLTNTKAVY